MAQLIISIMSKSISENPVFSEIWVRVGRVANLINCNVGFACISLPIVKVKAQQFRSKMLWSKLLLPPPPTPYLFLFKNSQNFHRGPPWCTCTFESEKLSGEHFWYPAVIWDLVDIVKPAGDRSRYRLRFNKHKRFKRCTHSVPLHSELAEILRESREPGEEGGRCCLSSS